MLAALLKHELPARDCIVQGPVDKTAVDACIAAGVGATVELSLGGKMDPVNAAPLAVTATVVFVQPETCEYISGYRRYTLCELFWEEAWP